MIAAEMEGLPLIRESEHLFGNKDLVEDGDVEISGKEDASESFNAKRKIESLFCVMRKRTSRQKSVIEDMFLDLDNNAEICDDGDDYIQNCLRPESDFRFENLMDDPYDPPDEGSIVDDWSCSGSDTDISESSEFDVISGYVLQDGDLITGSKSLSICNFPWPSEDERTIVNNDTSLFLSERKKDKMSCIPGFCEDILRCSVDKEEPVVPLNSDIFENDGDKSSVIEVRYGDVVSMKGSMEKMCSNDELKLWIKDDEPIPISIIPPDGWSNMLLETCSLHQIEGCINEYNFHDDDNSLEITPLPLTKILERPSRPWSVCSSISAVRNLPLVEDSSGACSSLDEQLYVNVSGSEDRDAELAQTTSTLYQEEVDGEDEICFSDIDAMIRKLNIVPEDSDSCLNSEGWNMSQHPRHALLGLEHSTRTSMQRAIMSQGAFAVLHCRDSKHFVKKREVIIGRSSDCLNVDIDLGKYGYGSKISRRQALVKLENYGSFSLKNLGKRHILVNGKKLDTGQTVTLAPCSSIEIRGITLVFKINKEAVRQFLKNNTRRKSEDNTKFRWCE